VTPRPTESKREQNTVGRHALSGRRLVDQPQLFHEAAICLGQAGDARGRAADNKRALEAFDQPGAKGIQPLKLGEVDIDAARADMAPRGLVDDFFEFGGAVGRPGARRHQRQTFAVGGGGERDRAHGRTLDTGAHAARDP
jgi:hypothetical protein